MILSHQVINLKEFLRKFQRKFQVSVSAPGVLRKLNKFRVKLGHPAFTKGLFLFTVCQQPTLDKTHWRPPPPVEQSPPVSFFCIEHLPFAVALPSVGVVFFFFFIVRISHSFSQSVSQLVSEWGRVRKLNREFESGVGGRTKNVKAIVDK